MLAGAGLDVAEACAATWGRDGAIQTFVVRGPAPPDPEALREHLHRALAGPPPPAVARDATLAWDDESSPWTTVCTIEAPDRTGLLAALSAAFSLAGAEVQTARATTTADGTARDVFEVTSRRGEKLGDAEKERVAAALAGEAVARGRLWIPWALPALRGRKPTPVPEA